MSYNINEEQRKIILELCAGVEYLATADSEYSSAIIEVMGLVRTVVGIELTFDVASASTDSKNRFLDRILRIKKEREVKLKARQEIIALKIKFNKIRDIMKQAEEAMQQDKTTKNAEESLEQIEQILGTKRKADNKDEDGARKEQTKKKRT